MGYTADTGSTKPSFELDLVRTQLFLGAGIFGCEDWKVYSDVETWISPAPKLINTIKVDDVEGNFHFEKRKKSGTWVNSNMFINTWKIANTSITVSSAALQSSATMLQPHTWQTSMI